jgi:vacuolar-type H+-ATPase subunit F/Vma7
LRKACVFIGDEVSAAGYRLAGVQCHTPSSSEAGALFQRLRDQAGLIMVTAEFAVHLPRRLLTEALREQRPPTLVIADIRGHRQPADIAAELKRQLGLAE